MKKEIPMGAIIGAVVVAVLLVVIFAWRTMGESNPPRDTAAAAAVKPDPLPEGVDPSRARTAPAGRARGVTE